ncbi:hypothetical protein H5410_030767 [Solanum commersonii]|uniref:Uncharacterized protein n=1 Tax=Solanum commersonii TaxID=4109 RepID=A0A9J5YH59_SOLCO|nr:hypothetical protein H5410_030767 [Solanum commersonii]
MQNLLFHLDINFDLDLKERTTSVRTEMQPLLTDFAIKVITCKAGNRICKSLQLSSPPDGEANNYKGVGFAREGGGGIPTLPGRDLLPSDRGPELAPNGRTMIFMSSVSLFWRPCFVIYVSVSLIFAETVVVSFDVNLSVWTVMGTITFDVNQH